MTMTLTVKFSIMPKKASSNSGSTYSDDVVYRTMAISHILHHFILFCFISYKLIVALYVKCIYQFVNILCEFNNFIVLSPCVSSCLSLPLNHSNIMV